MPHATLHHAWQDLPAAETHLSTLPGRLGPRPGTPLLLSTYQAVVNAARTTCGDGVKTTATRKSRWLS